MSGDYFLADNAYFGKNNTPQRFEKAVFHYEQAIKTQQHTKAMYMLGICYYNGTGVKKQSITYAIFYWNMAYEYGEEDHACYELGCVYYLGEGGIDEDHITAFRFWKVSADNGNIGSMIEVGDSYYHGDGVEKDIDKALEYWCRARRMQKI
jgi:hypothetical protein